VLGVVSVGYKQGAVAFICELLHYLLTSDLIFLFWGEFLWLSTLANEEVATFNHDFWGTFDKHSDLSFLSGVSDCASCSLPLGVERNVELDEIV